MVTKQDKMATSLARERIMDVATDLFYRQGYRATGINEVISKSGVAKATFYSHFPSKDDLGLAYLRQIMEGEIAHVDKWIRSAKGPLNRFLAVMRSLKPWLQETEFRGCAFINMASEVPDPQDSLRKVGREVYDVVRTRVSTLAAELIASDSKKYGHLDTRELTKEYMVVFTGAIALAEIYHAMWPVEHAMMTVLRLIGEQKR
jgi:AcrR family transcriptional regulator